MGRANPGENLSQGGCNMAGTGRIGGGGSVEVELEEGNERGRAAVGPPGGKPIELTFRFKEFDGSDDRTIKLAGKERLKFDWTP